ncbi:Carboxylic acid transporter [Recurvomyces mirabilis]|nr:Carboxylic acid transporter [Recurvomyces mirabilis]
MADQADSSANYLSKHPSHAAIHSGEPDEKMSAGRYVATRLSSLKPPMVPLENPFSLLRQLNRQQWAFFGIAFCGWAWDSFDFFTVSLALSKMAVTFGVTTKQMTWGITLTLMLRSVGAILFGILADRYGRKWPFVGNMILFIVLELATGFVSDYNSFLAVRALYGIAMGALYGNVASTALEDCPVQARGIISGLMQQGYAFGYLLAVVFARALVDTTSHGWRPLFWFGACPPVLLIIWRLYLPETNTFIERQQVRQLSENADKVFLREGKVALQRHWKVLLYMVLLMAGFNFMSHGSQDLYPTLLTNQYGFSANGVTITQVVANLGAILGGTTIGYLSQSLGRRLSIIIVCIIGGALLYPYTFTGDDKVIAAAFFEQFCVQGAWGVIPIYLMEMSPGSFRTLVVGASYQLGNLASSASSTIEATIGERFPLPSKLVAGKVVHRYDYGKVICIFLGCVYAYVVILILAGPEYRERSLGVAHDADLEIAAGHDAVAAVTGEDDWPTEKAGATRVEKV